MDANITSHASLASMASITMSNSAEIGAGNESVDSGSGSDDCDDYDGDATDSYYCTSSLLNVNQYYGAGDILRNVGVTDGDAYFDGNRNVYCENFAENVEFLPSDDFLF